VASIETMDKRSRRAKPGAKGEGDYYRIVVRPKDEFDTFRIHDVGKAGHIQRLAGKRSSGSWDTQVWLISQEDAHVEGGELIADSNDAKNVLENLGSKPEHIEGDRFSAKPRPNIPKKINQPLL
jgi:hypothetical protein